MSLLARVAPYLLRATSVLLLYPQAGVHAAPPAVTWETSPRWVYPAAPYVMQAKGFDQDGNLARVFVWKDGQPYAFNGGGNGVQNITDPNLNFDAVGTHVFSAEAADQTGATSRKIYWTVSVSDTLPPGVRWHTRPSIVFAGDSHTVRAQAHDDYGRLARVFVWRDGWPNPTSLDPYGYPFAFNGGGNGYDNTSDPNQPLDPLGHYLYQAEAADNRGVSSGFIEHLVSVIQPSTQVSWRSSVDWMGGRNPSPNAAWRYQYDVVDLFRPASSAIFFNDNYESILSAERRMAPPSWWYSPWGAWRRPNDYLLNGRYGIHTRKDYATHRTFVWTRRDSRTVRVTASLTKNGGVAEGTYGDGNILEVYKASYATGQVWPVYAGRFARGNSSAGRISFLTTMQPNDEIIFRGFSPTGDISFDGIDFDPEIRIVIPYVIQIPSGSNSAFIRDKLREAVAAAPTKDAVEVVFASGTYLIDTLPDDPDHIFRIDGGAQGVANVTVRGQGTDPVTGTRLVVNDALMNSQGLQRSLFGVTKTTSFALKDMAIDFATPALPWIQGTVVGSTALGSSRFQITIAADSNNGILYSPSIFGMQNTVGIVMDSLLRPKPGHPDFVRLESNLAGGTNPTFIVYAESATTSSFIVPGDKIVLVRRQTGEQTIAFLDNVEPRIENVTFYAGRGLAIAAVRNHGLHLQRVEFRRKGGRFLSSAGDALHFQSGRRGPTVQNCYFEGMGDDAINIYGKPVPDEKDKPDQFRVVTGSSFWALGASSLFTAGEPLLFYQQSNPGNFRLEATVASVSGNEVTVSAPFSIVAYDAVLNMARSSEGFIIRHNHFATFRGRGSALQTGYGLVAENLYTGTGGAPISLESGLDGIYVEGPFPRHILIRNNYFIGSAYTAGYGGVAVRLWEPSWGTPHPAFNDIVLMGNVAAGGMSTKNF